MRFRSSTDPMRNGEKTWGNPSLIGTLYIIAATAQANGATDPRDFSWISTATCRMVRTMARLNGKVAAVTGGASGIGEATVRRFVTEGAKVAFADRDVERGKRVAAEIAATGGQVIFVEAHMEREAEAADFVRQAAQRFGRLDILVNNAGVRLYHTVEEASAESWDEILGVNLKGYAFCAKAAIPHLRQAAPGNIVN